MLSSQGHGAIICVGDVEAFHSGPKHGAYGVCMRCFGAAAGHWLGWVLAHPVTVLVCSLTQLQRHGHPACRPACRQTHLPSPSSQPPPSSPCAASASPRTRWGVDLLWWRQLGRGAGLPRGADLWACMRHDVRALEVPGAHTVLPACLPCIAGAAWQGEGGTGRQGGVLDRH